MKSIGVLFAIVLVAAVVADATEVPAVQWKRPVLTDSAIVQMGGVLGTALDRGVKRIGMDPFSAPLVLADLNFGMKRWFTNYSGDVSGRFLQLASDCSAPDLPQPATLPEVMARIPGLQKSDGHFGADIDWNQPIDFGISFGQARMMPTLWGNGRILLGLLAAYERFEDPRLLAAARKLGDFYSGIVVNRFCDPKRLDEYRKSPGYAAAYVTCVFQGIEGIIRLYRVTKDARYLQTAERMADFHEAYDTLPVEHAHGSLGVHVALLMLYEDTGNPKYLQRVTDRWNKATAGGYVNPAGGVLEKFVVSSCHRDEGCAESDWLRLNLELWRATGETQYLDAAERTLWTEYLANQWPDGGYGHRFIATDVQGAYAYERRDQEALWCCVFHGPLGLYELKGYLAEGSAAGIYYNFPVDFHAGGKTGDFNWSLTSKSLPPQPGIPVRCEVEITGTGGAPLIVRIPKWADRVSIVSPHAKLPVTQEGGYLRAGPIPSGVKIEIAYEAHPYLENRRGERIPVPHDLPAKLDQVVLRFGPSVFVNTGSGEIQDIPLAVGPGGALQLPAVKPVRLEPWRELADQEAPHAFVFNALLQSGQ